MAEVAAKPALNPVEQRVAKMCTNWAAFRDDPSKRILIWQVKEDALGMVDAFVEMQKHQTYLSTGDTFVLFKTPYLYGLHYSRTLKTSLREQYDASREDLAKEGLDADWALQPGDIPDTPAGFVQAMLSFGSKYHRAIGYLTPVLRPTCVGNPDTYADWLTDLLKLALPERLRILLVDTSGQSHVQKLQASDDPRILIQTLNIDMGVLAQETFSQEAAVGPAGVFRNLLMGVVTLVEKGNADQVRSKAIDALNFARQQQWRDQEVVVRMLFAGALLKESRYDEAIRVYASARETAENAVRAGHPAGLQLALQTWFGQAGAELAAGQDCAAAASYDRAAAVARQVNTPHTVLEAYRMAGFCYSRTGEQQAALDRGQRAFEIAADLPAASRSATTAGTCIVDMLRIIDPARVEQMQHVKGAFNARMQQIQTYTERRGTELAQQGKSDALSTVESERRHYQSKAYEEARRPLEALHTSASPAFQAWAQRGTQLLGNDWLLTNALAMPPYQTGGCGQIAEGGTGT